MYRSNHETINFAKGYNKSFAEFKAEFAHVTCFKRIPHKKRDAEMKKVHKRVLAETKQFAKDEALAIEEQNKLDNAANDGLSNSENESKEADA